MRKKNRKLIKRIGILLAVLLVAYIILWITTPSVKEYYGDGGQTGVIAGLEIPLLEEGDELIVHTGFALVYDEEHEQPRWVAYELTRDEVHGMYERRDNFRPDPSISTESATLADYRGSGYDRGHLAPAADMVWSEEALSDSFYMSNMSPQNPEFNRGIWAKLEATVRNLATTEKAVHVVTGPILSDGPYKTIGKNKVSIPNYYYKVILDYNEPDKKAIGFLLPNAGSKKDLSTFATSVDEIEAISGIDFFPQLPDDEEVVLEANYAYEDWDMQELRLSKEERLAYSAESYTPTSTTNTSPTQSSLKKTIDYLMVEAKRTTVKLVESLWFSLTKKVATNL